LQSPSQTFYQDFQKYIDDGTIIPGWHTGKRFTLVGTTCHVSATNLTSITPLGSVIRVLHHNNPDHSIWLDSYKKEYDGLVSNNTFGIISEEEYQCLRRALSVQFLKCAVCCQTYQWGSHTSKSRIVFLGNLKQRSWTKADCFSPVILIPIIHFLSALAVHNGRMLKQADCKLHLSRLSYLLMSILLSDPQ
jgi:hypothetical protein